MLLFFENVYYKTGNKGNGFLLNDFHAFDEQKLLKMNVFSKLGSFSIP